MEALDFEFRPTTYFTSGTTTVPLVKLHYPETQWGEELTIFAELSEGMIYYEVADFYGNTYDVQPEYTAEPLTLSQLIFLIESMEDVTGNSENIDLPRMGVPEAESPFYPELTRYFDEKQRDIRKSS